MKLSKVTIESIGGIEYLEFATTGTLVEVIGVNGAGKTSVLTALRAVFESGHDFSVVKLGAKKGRVSLSLDDGTVVQLTITEKQSRVEITAPDGQTVPAPRSFLAELATGFSFDPTQLITATPKERTGYLLSVMPIKFDMAEIASTGAAINNPVTLVDGIADLDGLAAIRDSIYNTRKQLNKSVRDSEGTIASLRQGMPAEDGTDWQARWKELEAEATDVETQIRDAGQKADHEYSESTAILGLERDVIVADLQRQITALEEQVRVVRELYNVKKAAEARNLRDERLRHIADVAKPERERLATEKAQAWERSQAYGKAVGARQMIEAMAAKVRADSVESERLTRVLDALDALRRRKLDELPIPGVELKDGEVYVGGVPFEQLNTAQQFALSIRLAKLKLGRLSLMVVDHCEAFDAETWEIFRQSARDSGMQIVAAKVSDSALKVVAS